MKIWRVTVLSLSLGLLSLSCENNQNIRTSDNSGTTMTDTGSAMAASGPAVASEVADMGTSSGDGILKTEDGNRWYDDWNIAASVAEKEHKPMFIHFTATWCTWCRKMEAETYTDESIRERFKDWVLLKVDTEAQAKKGTVYLKQLSDTEGRISMYPGKEGFEAQTLTYPNMAQLFGVQGIPTLAYIDRDGILVYKASSYLPAEDLAQYLDYFHDEQYKEDAVNAGTTEL